MHNGNNYLEEKLKMNLGQTQALLEEETNTSFIDWVPDIIGCFGTLVILIAYILLQTRKLDSHHIHFSLLNLIGGFMLLVSLFYCWNLAAVVMEVSWVIVSGFGLVKILFPQGFKTRKKYSGSVFKSVKS
jgi:hypothetical protein